MPMMQQSPAFEFPTRTLASPRPYPGQREDAVFPGEDVLPTPSLEGNIQMHSRLLQLEYHGERGQ